MCQSVERKITLLQLCERVKRPIDLGWFNSKWYLFYLASWIQVMFTGHLGPDCWTCSPLWCSRPLQHRHEAWSVQIKCATCVHLIIAGMYFGLLEFLAQWYPWRFSIRLLLINYSFTSLRILLSHQYDGHYLLVLLLQSVCLEACDPRLWTLQWPFRDLLWLLARSVLEFGLFIIRMRYKIYFWEISNVAFVVTVFAFRRSLSSIPWC